MTVAINEPGWFFVGQPFEAVLLVCPENHYEATLKFFAGGNGNCGRCGLPMRHVKTVTIWPGGRR